MLPLAKEKLREYVLRLSSCFREFELLHHLLLLCLRNGIFWSYFGSIRQGLTDSSHLQIMRTEIFPTQFHDYVIGVLSYYFWKLKQDLFCELGSPGTGKIFAYFQKCLLNVWRIYSNSLLRTNKFTFCSWEF